MGFTLSEARLQDSKNRQSSIEIDDEYLKREWEYRQSLVIDLAKSNYDWAIQEGLAKEQARKVLPEGLTNTTLFMSGPLRSWIHYINERTYAGTQKEHRMLAQEAKTIVLAEFPSLVEVLQ